MIAQSITRRLVVNLVKKVNPVTILIKNETPTRNLRKKNSKNDQKCTPLFTACRRGLKVCVQEIGMKRLVIDQLRWHAVDRHDSTPPTEFTKI